MNPRRFSARSGHCRTYYQRIIWWQRRKTPQATVSYEQASEIVRAFYQSADWSWVGVDDREIVENDKLFVFSVLPRKVLINRDEHGLVLMGTVTVVHKADGRLERVHAGAFFTRDSNRRDRARWGKATTRRPNPNPRLIVQKAT